MRKWKKKTREQKQLLRRYKLVPWLWHISNVYKDGSLLVMHWLTGEFRFIGK